MKTFVPASLTSRFAALTGPARASGQGREGQRDEFKRLILPHLDGAYTLARYLTRDPALSEDVVQEAALRAFRALGQFRGGSAKAWLFAIVRNCCRTAQTSASCSISLVVHESSLSEAERASVQAHRDCAPTPEEEALISEDAARVRSAIEALPEPFRETIVLRDLEELSYAEIAQVTGVPVGTVMSRLSRGRTMLTKQLLASGSAGAEPTRSFK